MSSTVKAYLIDHIVGLSNILDSVITEEVHGRQPAKGSHGELVGAGLVGSELPTKVSEGIERAAIVEALLILAVAALHLAVVSRGVRANELVPNPVSGKRRFKERKAYLIDLYKCISA